MLAFLFNPSGRIGRAKWWLAQLIITVLAVSFVVLAVLQLSEVDIIRMRATEPLFDFNPALVAGFAVFAIIMMWVGFCITVKRYHDRGKSGWWFLLQFVPVVGAIWAFIELGFFPGDDGDNDYGDGPDLNIGDDLKALRKLSGQQEPVVSTAAYRPTRTANAGGPVVFGKRA